MSKNKNNKPYNDNIEPEVISVEEGEKVAEIENPEAGFDASEPETEEDVEFIEKIEKETTDYPICDEKVEVKAKKNTNVSDFIARKLKVINELSDEGKVNEYAQRVLRNK